MEETNPKVNEASAADATENNMEQNTTTPPIVDNSLASAPKLDDEVQVENSENNSNQIELSSEMIADEAHLQAEKEEEMPIESYAHLSKIELLDKLKNLAQTDEDGSAWQDVRTIKAAFYELVKEEQEKKLQSFIAEGGLREEFQTEKDELDLVFTEFFKGFDQRRQELKKKKDALLADNANKKRAIVENLKALAETANQGNMTIKAVFDQLHELQEQWRNVGMLAASDNRAIGDTYRYACDKVYEYIQIDKELRELNFKKNLELKKELCDKAEKLILEPSIRIAIDGIKQLQEEWKESGAVSREMNEVIWERFKKAADQVYARLKEYVETLKSKHDENKEGKLNLIQQLETLTATLPDNNGAWQKMTEEIETLLTSWKQLGFAAKKDNEELWNSFKGLRDRFFKAKEAHFEQSRKAQQENYRIKNDLCMKAEEVKDSSEWKKTTELIMSLQKQWKETGPVNFKQSEKLWQRFRAACDHYFDRKKANFADQDASQAENLKAKTELIAQIEAYQRLDDNNANFENLKNFQNQWLNIGHVPMKEKDRLNNAYRKAIDQHFDAMRAGNFERTKENYRNKIEHISTRPDAKNKVNEEMYQLQEKIRKKEHEAALLDNNIGFFGNSKGADSLLKETKKKIETLKSDIKLLKEQLKMLRNINSVEQEKK
jgi:heat shock protein HspQ